MDLILYSGGNVCLHESGWGGSGIPYSLKIHPIIHLIKILGYSLKYTTNYSLKVRER